MTTTLNAGTGVMRYLRVYTVLSQALSEGMISAGQALPSEPTLVREYGVSRTTIRRALARLASEGSIVRRRGSGTFVRERAEQLTSARQLAPILNNLDRLGSNSIVRVLAFKYAPTPDFLRREWPEFGASVLLVRVVRYIKHEPVVLVTTYVPEHIGRHLTPQRLGNDAVLVALDSLGHRACTGEQEISAVPADPLAARYLQAPVGAPLLNVRDLARDAKGQVVEYSNYLYRPDRYAIHTVIPRTRSQKKRSLRRS